MRDKKEKKRNLILDAAFELLLKNGYSNTKVIDIANRAGIGKGTFYEYFDSKEALVLELVNTKARQDYVMVCAQLENIPSYKQKLITYFDLEVETTSRYKANINDVKNEFLAGQTEISLKIMEAIHGIMFLQFEFIQDIIKEGITAGEFKDVDPFSATACFIGCVNFYMSLLHFDSPLNVSGGQAAGKMPAGRDSLLDCVFNGLLANTSG
jgi:AcrR family transcriptional regulator